MSAATPATPRLDPLPPDALTLADHARIARERLTPEAWAYFSGGAGDEHTLRDNEAAWQRWSLWPRVLRDLRGLDTACKLLGHRLQTPVMLAPVAYQRMAHPDGELASAMAAAAQGAGMVLSTQSSVPVEQVAAAFRQEPGAGPLWFQLYAQPDAGHTRELVQRAEAAGCTAIVLTVDAPLQGVRDRERRAGFRLPPDVRAVHLPGGLPASGGVDVLLDTAARWDGLDGLLGLTRLPVLLKGVLHPADAAQAVRAGAAGLIVSNHGGRTLDTAVSTAWALPRVADAVAGAVPLLVDGGVRRGTDILKARALGADAVLLGRPQVHALATAGALGVAQMLRLLRDELTAAMALCGCRTLADIDSELIVAMER